MYELATESMPRSGAKGRRGGAAGRCRPRGEGRCTVMTSAVIAVGIVSVS